MKLNENNTKYKEVEQHVKRIKNFYNHLQIFIVMMLVLAFFSNTIINFFEARITNLDSLNWMKANIWINALLWFLVIVIHGIVAFKFDFIDDWENKKTYELMNKNK